MLRELLIYFAVLVLIPQLHAQERNNAAANCAAHKKKAFRTLAKSTSADVGEDNYDVRHLQFNLNATDTSVYINGDVITTAVVVATSMSEYVFELDTVMTIDSAKVNGVLLPVTTTASVRRIPLVSSLASGTTFTAQVFYHGFATPASGSYLGLVHSISTGGTHVVFSLSEALAAKFWWPCKQSLTDKTDSVDMFVTVPAGIVDGSNGLLVAIDSTTTAGYWQYHWKTNYPIDYYLISVAIARFGDYRSYMHFAGSADSMLIQNFVLDTGTFMPLYGVDVDSAKFIIDKFSASFGRYPFWQEKYGMCFTGGGGGMENQTMSTMGSADKGIIAHELAHQWFGDNVTQRGWGDIWLAEGFACFGSQLFDELFYGIPAGVSTRRTFLNSGLAYGGPCGMVYVNDSTNEDSIFTTNQYGKAEVIINTLRYLAPADSLFFKVLRTYQSTHAFRNAGTADFKAVAESIYGFSLDTFFNQWIYGRGYPVFNCSWNQVGGTAILKLTQTQSCPSVTSHFSTPVEVRLVESGLVDTFFSVYNTSDTQLFEIPWSHTVNSVLLNPSAWTFMKASASVKDISLTTGVADVNLGKAVAFPNPSAGGWNLMHAPKGTKLSLMDIAGRVLWQGMSVGGETQIPGQGLPPGTYLLNLSGTTTEHVKLVHW
jgi:aminopeptidase N